MNKKQEWETLKAKIQAIADNPAPKGYRYDPDTQQMVAYAVCNLSSRKLNFRAGARFVTNAAFRDVTFVEFIRDKHNSVESIYWRHPKANRDNVHHLYNVPLRDQLTITKLVDSGKIESDLAYKVTWTSHEDEEGKKILDEMMLVQLAKGQIL